MTKEMLAAVVREKEKHLDMTKEMLSAVVRLQAAALAAGSAPAQSETERGAGAIKLLATRMPSEYLGKGLVGISKPWKCSTGGKLIGHFCNVEVVGDSDGNTARRITLQGQIRNGSTSGKQVEEEGADI